jgi:hypothetical protein
VLEEGWTVSIREPSLVWRRVGVWSIVTFGIGFGGRGGREGMLSRAAIPAVLIAGSSGLDCVSGGSPESFFLGRGGIEACWCGEWGTCWMAGVTSSADTTGFGSDSVG